MIFQLLDFGPLSARLQQYADLEGWIPSRGDRWQDFHWSRSLYRLFADRTNGEQMWQQFLEGASAATRCTLEAFEELHDVPSHVAAHSHAHRDV